MIYRDIQYYTVYKCVQDLLFLFFVILKLRHFKSRSTSNWSLGLRKTARSVQLPSGPPQPGSVPATFQPCKMQKWNEMDRNGESWQSHKVKPFPKTIVKEHRAKDFLSLKSMRILSPNELRKVTEGIPKKAMCKLGKSRK